jgi:DNA/RNA endonuclease G (NUC1)
MVEYDPRKFVANWLLERLTIENASSKNQAKRLNLNWNADPKLAKMFQPVEEDYKIAKVRFVYLKNNGKK